jgi:two-component system, OmpR family, response regulator
MRVLIAEDDDELAASLQRRLAATGHDVCAVADGESALRHSDIDSFDVIILDRMLPGVDGVAVLRQLRARGLTSSILLLTALGQIGDRVDGLEAGADDYLVKPFVFAELAARLNALARRPSLGNAPVPLTVADVMLDPLKREVRRAGRLVYLQPREFSLLEQLMRRAGEIVTRKMLLELIWNFDFDPQTNIVESHLSRLRSKLNQGHSIDPIETLRGIGYRMRADA